MWYWGSNPVLHMCYHWTVPSAQKYNFWFCLSGFQQWFQCAARWADFIIDGVLCIQEMGIIKCVSPNNLRSSTKMRCISFGCFIGMSKIFLLAWRSVNLILLIHSANIFWMCLKCIFCPLICSFQIIVYPGVINQGLTRVTRLI